MLEEDLKSLWKLIVGDILILCWTEIYFFPDMLAVFPFYLFMQHLGMFLFNLQIVEKRHTKVRELVCLLLQDHHPEVIILNGVD